MDQNRPIGKGAGNAVTRAQCMPNKRIGLHQILAGGLRSWQSTWSATRMWRHLRRVRASGASTPVSRWRMVVLLDRQGSQCGAR